MAIFDLKIPGRIAKALNLPVSNPRQQQLKVLKRYCVRQGLRNLASSINLMKF